MNNRRNLLIAISAALFTPGAVFAQAKKPPVVIGWLDVTSPDLYKRELSAFKEALAAHGWKDGADIVIEARWAEGRPDRMPLLVELLVLKKSVVIVVSSGLARNAARKHAPKVPVVQFSGPSPILGGHAASLARPGGLVTGVINLAEDLIGKHSEILVDVLPDIRRIGYLLDSNLPESTRDRYRSSARLAADRRKRQYIIAEAGRVEELEGAFGELRNNAVQGLVVLPSSYLLSETRQIAQLALKHKLPTIVTRLEAAEAGALISYGHDPIYNATRAAWYVDQILKGRKPGDLPIEQPSKFELVVNLKTAKALGITVPPVVMVQATQVIQ